MGKTYAYCYRNGVIKLGTKVPGGAIRLARGPRRALTNYISAVARHAYDGHTLLVPGVPEAEDDDGALKALLLFITWLQSRQKEYGIDIVKSGI